MDLWQKSQAAKAQSAEKVGGFLKVLCVYVCKGEMR